jgi:hypothetical protein
MTAPKSRMYSMAPAQGVGELDGVPTSVLVIGGVAVVGLMGFLVWKHYQMASTIVEKEGSSGLLKYELGTAAIGVGSRVADRLTRNKRKSRRGRSRRRH